jgi:2'-phosphotransferase
MADSTKTKPARRARAPLTPEVRLSKTLSWALRHGAEELGLTMRASGYVPLAQLLATRKFRGVTEAQVEHIVRTNDKKRFTITTDESGEVRYIRANQGHTLQIVQDEELLTPIEDPAEVPQCIHGTYMKFWASILENGLSRMTRNHIHMTPAEVTGGEIVSGMRASCDLLLFIDHALAMQDGIKFYRSSNNVILSPGFGDSGVIERKYFLKAVTTQGKVVYGDSD